MHVIEGKIVHKSALVGESSKASVDSSNSQDVEISQTMLSNVQAKGKKIESEIEQISKEIQQAQVEVQVQSKGETFLKQLQEAREELAALEAGSNVPLERVMTLQAVISANVQVLNVLGIAKGSTSKNNNVAAIQVD